MSRYKCDIFSDTRDVTTVIVTADDEDEAVDVAIAVVSKMGITDIIEVVTELQKESITMM